jgi:hypothetical protein
VILSQVVCNCTHSYTFVIQNIDMAKNTKGKQGRMTLPKKGVNLLSKKKSSESIIHADDSALVHNRKDKRVTTCDDPFDDDSSDVSNPPTSKVASVPAGSTTEPRLKKLSMGVNLSKKRSSEFITPTDEFTFVRNQKYKTITARDDVFHDDSSDVSDPPTSKVASFPDGSATKPRLKKLSTAIAKPPPTQVFETEHSSEDDSSILEDDTTNKPSLLVCSILELAKKTRFNSKTKFHYRTTQSQLFRIPIENYWPSKSKRITLPNGNMKLPK